jgi:hypothetical protein
MPQGNRAVKEYSLTERSKVEFDGDGIAFGGSHQDRGGIGIKGFRGELDLDHGAREDARAPAPPASGFCFPLKRSGLEELIAAGDQDAEILPEVIRAPNERRRRGRSSVSRVLYETAIRSSELDVDEDLDVILLALMVKTRLLSAVVADVAIGEEDELDEGSEEGDGRNIGTRLRRREAACVFVEKAENGSVMALAEEIGLADGFIREDGVEGGSWGRCQTKRQKQDDEEA